MKDFVESVIVTCLNFRAETFYEVETDRALTLHVTRRAVLHLSLPWVNTRAEMDVVASVIVKPRGVHARRESFTACIYRRLDHILEQLV